MRGFIFVLTLVAALGQSHGWAQDCAEEKLCTRMRSCAEADYYFRQCGHSKRDADNDGIPCESICGDTMEMYLQRRQSGAGDGAAIIAPSPGTSAG
jgi:hypothetical protein